MVKILFNLNALIDHIDIAALNHVLKQIKLKKKNTLIKYQIQLKSNPNIGFNCKKLKGGNQPPKKNRTFKLLSNTILRYSPRKKKQTETQNALYYIRKLTQIQPQVNQMEND